VRGRGGRFFFFCVRGEWGGATLSGRTDQGGFVGRGGCFFLWVLGERSFFSCIR